MHSTSSTVADINSARSPSGPRDFKHGALRSDKNGGVVNPTSLDHGDAGGVGASGAGLAGRDAPVDPGQGRTAQGKGKAGFAHARVEPPQGVTLNPYAQEFKPGAPQSQSGVPAGTQKGLLATPPPEGKGEGTTSDMRHWKQWITVEVGSRSAQARPQQTAYGPAGRRDERQSEMHKSGDRSGPSRAHPGPPRVTGWDAPARPPPNLGSPLRSPLGLARGGLSSALQSQASPTSGQDQARGSETPASVRRGPAVNANFLLNFKYEEHKRQPAGRPLPPQRRRERLKPYNKELFLQANFRFLVSDLSDYSASVRDPDRMLDWEDVAAVEVLAPTPLQCPICLEQPPHCPQITLCGHIFCFPCLLRYLTQGEALAVDYKGDGPWKKCPLCFTLISVKDLRTVTIRSVPQYKAGNSIPFTLLTRAKGSIIPFERAEAGGLINPSPSALCDSDNGQCALFAKFTLTSSIESVTSIATQALTALADRTAESMLDDPDALPYIYGAMDHLQARAQAWADHRSSAFLSSSPPVRQRILAQAAGGEQKLLGRSPREAAKALAGTGGEKQAPGKLEPGGWGEADVSNSELKQKAAWVYEDAFSDAGSEESGEARSLEMRKESALRTIEEGLAARKGGASEEDDGSATESGSDQDGGLGGFAPDKKRQRKKRLAKVPEDAGKREGAGGNGGVKEEQERAWYCFYQASDGQSVFLHPLSMKCLLQHYGSYEALPPSLEATLVEAESVTMATEGTRKKYRYLSHLSLTGAFMLCEMDLRPMLPPTAFAPFQDEITARERRRARAQKQERDFAARQAREQALAAASANKRSRPPAPEDFAAMLSAMEEAELEQAMAISGGTVPQGVSPPATSSAPSVPIAFSQVTKMGYASAYDAPALCTEPNFAPAAPNASPPPPRWGPRPAQTSNGEPLSFAAKLQAEKAKEAEPAVQQGGDGQAGGKKNKKGAKMLLSTGSARRY